MSSMFFYNILSYKSIYLSATLLIFCIRIYNAIYYDIMTNFLGFHT